MGFTLTVQNFRGLRRVNWQVPQGLSVLVGPNGSGKTTLLEVLDTLRLAFGKSPSEALSLRGGTATIRNIYAPPDEPVKIGLQVQSLRWEVQLAAHGGILEPRSAEKVTQGEATLLYRPPGAEYFDWMGQKLKADERLALRITAEVEELQGDNRLQTLVHFLYSFRAYPRGLFATNLAPFMSFFSDSPQPYLLQTGQNMFSLLRNWRDKREYRKRWGFVMEGLQDAFPDSFQDLEFESAGTTVTGRIIPPRSEASIPVHLAANGWWTALFHLCGVASAEPGGAVAIDEPENGLHPFAIKKLFEFYQDWADENNLSILFATHSPVVLSQFAKQPERVFVMESGAPELPIPLDKHRNPEWLSRFSLGDLYIQGEYGAPKLDE